MVCLVFAQTRSIFLWGTSDISIFSLLQDDLCAYIQLGIFRAFPIDWKPCPPIFLIANVMINHGLWETLSDKPI